MTPATRTALGDGRTIAELCRHIMPEADDALLLENIQAAFPHHTVRLVRSGQPWFRLGGVVDSRGNPIAPDLVEWAERTYVECGQNLHTLIDHAREQALITTRHQGITLYFVARTGERADAFVQIEIDRTVEVTDRLMVDPENPPEDLEEIIDPVNPCVLKARQMGRPRYSYRRKTEVWRFMEELSFHHLEKHPVQRFMDDWDRSSAGRKATFCNDWSLHLYQHTGRFDEQIINVEVISAPQNRMPQLGDTGGKTGSALSSLLTRFDRQAGYPFAWYFYMVKGLLVSPHIGEAVHQDLTGDFAYLPDRDAKILADWIRQPYNV